MSINGSTTRPLGWRIGEAVEFLVNLLAGKELPSEEVLGLAQEAGIAETTLNRAKHIVNAKARRKHMKWYTSVPTEMKERAFNIAKRPRKEFFLQPDKDWEISSDWVSIVASGESVGRHKIDVPARVSSGGLRVKVGMYEFEADENFPADKLAELLRSLSQNASVAVSPGMAVTGG